MSKEKRAETDKGERKKSKETSLACKVARRVSCPVQDRGGEGAQDARDASEHGGDGLVLEEDVARKELRQDAPQRPDVHLGAVLQAQDDLQGGGFLSVFYLVR